MADVTIDTLPVVAPLTGAELIPVDQGAPLVTSQLPVDTLATYILAGVAAFNPDGSVEMTDAMTIRPDGINPSAVAAIHLLGRPGKESFITGSDKAGSGTWKLGRLTGGSEDITLMNSGNVGFTLPAGMTVGANIGGVQKSFAYAEDVMRPSVVMGLSSPASKAEAILAVKLIPGYTNTAAFWAKGRELYVSDNVVPTKMTLIKYTGTAADETDVSNMQFWAEELTLLA